MGSCVSKPVALVDTIQITSPAKLDVAETASELSKPSPDGKLSTAGSAQPAALPAVPNNIVKLTVLPPAPAPGLACESAVNTNIWPDEQPRDRQLRACSMIDTPPEPRFDAITKLMASIFKTPVSLLTLIVDDRVWFKSKVGPFGACVDRDGSWCNYILVPTKPEVLITEDASVDARFSGNPYVAGEPRIKFYAGAPLVGTGGVRYGTLCVVDLVPRSFSAEMYSLLTNFAQLAVQELERDNEMLKHLVRQKTSFADNHVRMSKAVSSAVDGLAMIDIRSKPWPVLYANDTFAEAAGRQVDDCTQQGFWDQFEPAGLGEKDEMARVDAAVAAGQPVRIAVRCRASGALVALSLRPAATDQIHPHKPVGVPNWVRSEKELQQAGQVEDGLQLDTSGAVGTIDPQLASCFYLAVVEPWDSVTEGGVLPTGSPVSTLGGMARLQSEGSTVSPATPEESEAFAPARPPRSMMAFGDHCLPPGLAGLEMGPLIGSGSFAKVYRGFWKGGVVAVKVVDCNRHGSLADDVMAEAVLSKGLVHENIVRTFTYDVDCQILDNGIQVERGTVYLVQQHLNRGTLIDAVEKGWFRQKTSLSAPANMRAVLRTLREVAAGMVYVHQQSILHRDLTGNNVLLGQCDSDERGFRAYVADFGLSRVARGGAISCDSFGTVTHMPPEVLQEGETTPAADVYSFGVLAWEMFNGSRAFPGLRPHNVIYKIISGEGLLRLPETAPAGYKALVHSCLSVEPQERPPFTEVLERIDGLLKEEA
ncbi:hypothetical protein N2152v2_000746 [Parachlorella kessleri]